jgi:hypothetical protein
VIGEGTLNLDHYLPVLIDLNAHMIFEVRPRERALICLARFMEHMKTLSAVN